MRTFVLVGALAGLVACGSAPPPAPVAAPPKPAPAPTAAKPAFPGTPATPVGDALAWALDAIVTRHGKVERAELAAHFDKEFLDELTPDQVIAGFAQLGPQLAGLKLGNVESDGDRLIAHATAGETKLRILLALDPASHKIAALAVRPDVDEAPRPASFDEALRMVTALAPRAQLLVAALDNGACRPMQELAATEPLAIGATFKLYVLLALADRVIAGKAAWTDEIAVRDDWKSLPSGTTQNEPPGTKRSLATLAERMISISDNTAADHLLYTLGRKDVEAAVRATKHAKPALVVPFLSTRELFVFRLGTPDAEVQRYLKLPEAGRRAYLDKTLAGKDPNIGVSADWKGARHIDKLEWFASSLDLCRAMGALWTRAQNAKAAPVLDILAKNPGLPVDTKVWPYVGFKGGSEPGVLNLTFLLKRDDSKWFVVALGFNAADGGTVDQAKVAGIASGVIELLGASR